MNNNAIEELLKRTQTEPYALKLDIKAKKIEPGYALVEMKFTKDLQNLLGTMHGGAIFSLIDEAFELSSNSYGTIAVALNMNITYFAAPELNSTLRAEAKEVNRTNRTGTYQILVTDDKGRQIALCQALAYRKKESLPFLEETKE